MKINENLKKLRTSKNLSQSDMAEILNVSLSSYQKYERDKNNVTPSLEVLERIADYYGITLDYLLGREPLPDPFADFHLTKEIEDDMLKKYLALPEGVRVCVMDAIRQLGKTMPDDTQNGSEDVTDDYITITERAGDIVDQVKNADEKDGVS